MHFSGLRTGCTGVGIALVPDLQQSIDAWNFVKHVSWCYVQDNLRLIDYKERLGDFVDGSPIVLPVMEAVHQLSCQCKLRSKHGKAEAVATTILAHLVSWKDVVPEGCLPSVQPSTTSAA